MLTKATIKYGPLTFCADLPGDTHPKAPGKAFVSAIDLHRLEQAAARWIVEHGITMPETLRALRAAAGLTGSQLAELLGVSTPRVYEWENGKADPGIALWNTVAALALDAMDGHTTTVDRLRATQTEQQTEGEIKLAVG